MDEGRTVAGHGALAVDAAGVPRARAVPRAAAARDGRGRRYRWRSRFTGDPAVARHRTA